MEKKEVFITYSWDNEDHKQSVLNFCNHLRKEGFHCNIDRKVSQEQSSADFFKMMHSAMTDYNKVIVVLSEGYKKKADNFERGVGVEYSLIIKDIDVNTQKYILVTFSGVEDKIMPLNFRQREVIDLSNSDNWNKLYGKLMNVDEFTFAEVGKEKPIIVTKEIAEFQPKKPQYPLLFNRIESIFLNGSMFANKYNRINYSISIIVENTSSKLINDFSIECAIPSYIDKKREGISVKEYFVYSFPSSSKIYPSQSIAISCGEIIVTNKNIQKALKDNVVFKIYTDQGVLEKKYPVSEFLVYGSKTLSEDDFGSGSYY